MADPPHYLDPDDDPDIGSTAGPPRWMPVAVVIAMILLIVGFIVLHLTGALGPGVHR